MSESIIHVEHKTQISQHCNQEIFLSRVDIILKVGNDYILETMMKRLNEMDS